jgi:hypothetical protein
VFLLSPKSCTNLWSDSGDRELDLGELTCGCCSSSRGSVGFASGDHLGEFVVVLCCCRFEFGFVWSSVGLFGEFGVFRLELV